MEKNWKYVDALKLTVILIIVLNHSIQYGWNLYKIVTNDAQNPTLIFASGLIFSFCIVDLKKYETFQNLICKKARRLLLPLFLTLFLYYLPIIKIAEIFVDVDERYDRPFYRIIIDYILGLGLDQLWFVYALFIMYTLAYFIIKSNVLNKALGITALIIASIGANIIQQWFHCSYFCLGNIMRYSVFFVGGYFFNIYVDCKVVQKFAQTRILNFVVAITLIVLIYALDIRTSFLVGTSFVGNDITKLIMSFLEIIKQFALIFVLSVIVKAVYDKTEFYHASVLTFLIRNSFSIYLFHQPIVRLSLPIAHSLFMPKTKLELFMSSFIVAVFAVCVALLVSQLVVVVKKKLFQITKGEKNG